MEQVGDDADQLEAPVDRGDRGVGGFFDFGIEVRGGDKLVEQAFDPRIGVAGQIGDRLQLFCSLLPETTSAA